MKQTLINYALIAGRTFEPGDEIECTPDVLELGEKAYRKQQLRNAINADVGDMLSLLGSTNDVTQFLMLFAGADLVALTQTTDFDTYKQKRLALLTAINGTDGAMSELVQCVNQLLIDVQTGGVMLPFLLKNNRATGALTDLATRGNGVAQLLQQQATA